MIFFLTQKLHESKRILFFLLLCFSLSSYGGEDNKCKESLSSAGNNQSRSEPANLREAFRDLKAAFAALFKKRTPAERAIIRSKKELEKKLAEALREPDDIGDRGKYDRRVMYVNQSLRERYAANPKVYKELAEYGDKEDQLTLGIMYLHGLGVEQDYGTARYWIVKSADKWNPDAQYSLGLIYYHGIGTKEDGETAFYWFDRAGRQYGVSRRFLEDYDYRQSILDNMYILTEGEPTWNIQKDFHFQKAFPLLEQLGLQGNPAAQYLLSIMYYGGHGAIEDNPVQAYKWALLAKDNEAKSLPISLLNVDSDYKKDIGILLNDMKQDMADHEIEEALALANQIKV